MPVRHQGADSAQHGFTPNFILGAAIVVLAFFTVLANIALYRETQGLTENDKQQRDCVATSFADLTEALTVRSQYTTQVNELRDRQLVLLVEGHHLNAEQISAIGSTAAVLLAPGAQNRPELIEAAVTDLLEKRKDFETDSAKVTRQIQRLREDVAETLEAQASTPIPPFPAGDCQTEE